MRSFQFQFGIFVLSLAFLSGCNFDPFRKSVTISGKPESVLGENSVVSTEIVQKTALSSCQSCHTGVRPPDLSTAALVRVNLSKVQSEIFSDQMPPASAGYSAVSECYKDILKKWVELGTPDASDVKVTSLPGCASGEGQPPAQDLPILQMPVDYQTLNAKILQPKCLNCHNPKGDPDAQDILLFPYSELASRKTLLGTSSDQSKLVKLVTRTDENRMPPPDSTVQPLTADEVEFLKKWIDAGHPEKAN